MMMMMMAAVKDLQSMWHLFFTLLQVGWCGFSFSVFRDGDLLTVVNVMLTLGMNEVMRTYNGGAPHSLLGGWGGGGHHQLQSPSLSSGLGKKDQDMVWDCFHFPLVAPVVTTKVNFT